MPLRTWSPPHCRFHSEHFGDPHSEEETQRKYAAIVAEREQFFAATRAEIVATPGLAEHVRRQLKRLGAAAYAPYIGVEQRADAFDVDEIDRHFSQADVDAAQRTLAELERSLRQIDAPPA